MANRFKEYLCNLFKRTEHDVVEKTPFYIYKKRTALDYVALFLGIAISLLVIFNLVKITGVGNLFDSGDHIGTVKIYGMVSKDDDVNVYSITKSLEEAFKDPNSKAVVLKINSGGGSPYHSETIYNEIMYLKSKYPEKKLYAVVEDVAASAAYYIASSADEIILSRSSIIGSIGVLMSNYDIRGLADKVGVKDRTLHAGRNKIAYSMFHDVTPEQEAHVNAVLKDLHSHFIQAVKDGRGKRLKDDPDLFTGDYWTGTKAIELGIADRFGDMNTLKRELKIDKVRDYTVTKGSFSEIFSMSASTAGKAFANGMVDSVNEESEMRFR